MKTKWYFAIALPLACLLLASFATLPGTDTFEVFLDNELIMKEAAFGKREPKVITLEKTSTATMTVSYNHCGITGSTRTLSLLDDQRNVLKEWKFADVNPSVKDPMPLPVKEIAAVASGKNATLFYKSRELDNAVMIASVKMMDKSTASK